MQAEHNHPRYRWCLIGAANRGIALVQALMLSVIMAVVLLSFAGKALQATKQAEQAQNRVQGLVALQQAESEVTLALLAGTSALNVQHGVINRYAVPFQLGHVSVSLQDLAGLQLLATNSANGLERLLKQLGVDEREAVQIARALEDWQDSDNEVRFAGAEQKQYQTPVQVRNAPLQTLDELRYIRGMTDMLFRKVSPFLTLYSDGYINLMTAPEPVLAAYIQDKDILRQLVKKRNNHQLTSTELIELTGVQLTEQVQVAFGRGVKIELNYRHNGQQMAVIKEVILRPYDMVPISTWSEKRY